MGKESLFALVMILSALVTSTESSRRRTRFAEFNPPKITPDAQAQTVKAHDSYTFRCEGTDRGISWRLPVDATEELRSRVRLSHSARLVNRQLPSSVINVAQLTIRYNSVVYMQTQLYYCINMILWGKTVKYT